MNSWKYQTNICPIIRTFQPFLFFMFQSFIIVKHAFWYIPFPRIDFHFNHIFITINSHLIKNIYIIARILSLHFKSEASGWTKVWLCVKNSYYILHEENTKLGSWDIDSWQSCCLPVARLTKCLIKVIFPQAVCLLEILMTFTSRNEQI